MIHAAKVECSPTQARQEKEHLKKSTHQRLSVFPEVKTATFGLGNRQRGISKLPVNYFLGFFLIHRCRMLQLAPSEYEITMPKFTPFKNTDADDDKIEAFLEKHELGGLCVAMSLEWLERIYQNKPLPESFEKEDLDALAEQQLTYNTLALQAYGDQGFIDYCKNRGSTVEKIKGDSCAGGEIYNFQKIVLEPNTGYMLSFSETDIGAQKAHVIALYRTSNGPLQIRDQNIGQMEVSNEAELFKEYNEVMKEHWKNYNEQSAGARREDRVHVPLPDYRRWALYKVTRV